jgi:hypothetical protein
LSGTALQAEFLRKNGFPYAIATGAPFIYQRPLGLPRQEGSLLAMPPHADENTGHHHENAKQWVDYLLSLRSKFKRIVACVHRSCVGRFWTPALDEADVPWICGAHGLDMNSLIRMRVLFESFECVNSSVIGSQVAYAAYAGARPSISGPDLHPLADAFAADPFYQKYPHLLMVADHSHSRERVREDFPFICCEPDKVPDLREWGQEMLGEPCRRTFPELGRLLGWKFDPHDASYRGLNFADIAPTLGWGDSYERTLAERAKMNALQESKTHIEMKLAEVERNQAAIVPIFKQISLKLDALSPVDDVRVPAPSIFKTLFYKVSSRAFRHAASDKQTAKDVLYLKGSPFFDADWYLKEFPDVAQSGQDAATHFVVHGEKLGRPPTPIYSERHIKRAMAYRKRRYTGCYYVQYLKILEEKSR